MVLTPKCGVVTFFEISLLKLVNHAVQSIINHDHSLS